MKVLLATDGSKAATTAEALVASVAWPAGSTIAVLRVDQFVDDEIDMSEPRFAVAHTLLRAEIDEHPSSGHAAAGW